MKFQVISYQLINANGSRDTVRLLQPETVSDIEEYRTFVAHKYPNAISVNLTYTEVEFGKTY